MQDPPAGVPSHSDPLKRHGVTSITGATHGLKVETHQKHLMHKEQFRQAAGEHQLVPG